MKSFATIILAAGLVAAQSIPDLSKLPQCAQTCIGNMLGKAGELGCGSTDVACLCKNENFRFGIRDCSAAICDAADQATAVSFGNSVCAQYTSGVATVTATTTVGTATVVVSTGTDSNGSPVASTLATVHVTTFTESNGTTVTSTIGAGGAGGAGGVVTTLTGSDLSAFTSATAAAGASSASTSAAGLASSLASAASSAAAAASNAGHTSSSAGAAAPIQTPYFGGLAIGALALAALL